MFFMKSFFKNLPSNNLFQAAIGYIALTIIYTYPAITRMNNLIGPAGDNQLSAWMLWWFKYSLVNLSSNPWHSNYLFYPDGTNLFIHTLSPLICGAGFIIQLIFSLEQTYNILISGAFVLSGLTMYMFCRYLNLGKAAAFIAGMIFTFNPAHIDEGLMHLNITSIYLIPLVLLFILKQSKTPTTKNAIMLGILLVANFYLDYWMLLFSVVLSIPLLLIHDRKTKDKRLFNLKQFVPTIIITIVAIMPILIGAIRESTSEGWISPGGYDFYVIDLPFLFIPHAKHWINLLIPKFTSGIELEGFRSQAFIGYFVMILALWSIIKYKFPYKKHFITMGLIALILALGPYLHFWGLKIKYCILPYYIIEHVPFINQARTPYRFILIFYLAMAIPAAVTVQKIFEMIKEWKILSRAGILLLIILAISVDYYSGTPAYTNVGLPGYLKEIKSEKPDFAIMNIPIDGQLENIQYMYLQTKFEKPILGGFISRLNLGYFHRLSKTEMPPSYFKKNKIKYLFLFKDLFPKEDYDPMYLEFKSKYALVSEENDIAIFKTY
jgi:hypothetical protein